MVDQPDSLILRLLREMHGDIADIRATMATKTATKNDLAELRAELKSDTADVASDLLPACRELGEQIVASGAPLSNTTPP